MSSIRGPGGEIAFERDAWGYPSVRARDVEDGAYATGWFHAVDRLVQVQMTVAIARGQLMSLVGDSPLSRSLDRVAHMFDFAGDAQEQVDRFDDSARSLLNAYCAGFAAGAKRRGWPWVLRLLGLKPEPFTPASAVLISRLGAYFGITSLQLVAEAVVCELATSGASPRLLELLGVPATSLVGQDALADTQWPDELSFLSMSPLGGSNAFAVAKRRSRTGGALLMTEPHLEVACIPPRLYALHIDYEAGGYLQGMSIPGLPLPTFGRSDKVAWGFTYAHGNAIDVVVERCKEGQYQASGEWRSLRRRTARVNVRRRKTPEEWVFWDNDYGTIVGDASRSGDLPCIRWSGLREVWSDFTCGAKLIRAQTVAEAIAALRHMKSVSLHAVLADDSGAIGYVQTGQIDERPDGWTGVLPWPGWQGARRPPPPLPETARPVAVDPAEGFIASANEARSGPGGEQWCDFPEPPYRNERITQLLSDQPSMDLTAMARISYDAVDLCAKRLLAVWEPLLPAEPDARRLCAWANSQTDSGDDHWRMMGWFHALRRELTRELVQRHMSPAEADQLHRWLHMDVSYQHHLDRALALERRELLDADELRELLARAWPRARARAENRELPVPVVERFKNLVTRGKLWLLGFDTKRVVFPGGPTTCFQSQIVGYLGEQLVVGPGAHFVTDMSQRGGWYNIAGGASERRFGPGYGAGLDEWRTGQFHPLGNPTGPAPTA